MPSSFGPAAVRTNAEKANFRHLEEPRSNRHLEDIKEDTYRQRARIHLIFNDRTPWGQPIFMRVSAFSPSEARSHNSTLTATIPNLGIGPVATQC